MNYRFHHVHLICKDLEEMITFFTDALQATLIGRKKFGTADGASLDIQGTIINLRVAREDEHIAPSASQTRFGYDHIGLQVEDIDAAYQDLKKRGFSFFMAPKDIPDLRIAFFRGPEDIIIELVQEINPSTNSE